MTPKLTILDCTCRDGGYYNRWDFDPKLVQLYLVECANAGLDIVEIGFRSPARNSFMGAHLYSLDHYLLGLKIEKNLCVCVMVNANEFTGVCENQTTANVEAAFSVKSKSVVDLVRIAVSYDNYLSAKPIAMKLKELGYQIGFNLMQAHGKSEKSYNSISQAISDWKVVDVLYFADSLGCMEPNEVAKIVNSLKYGWKGPLGFHAHDNKGGALTNLLVAIEAGVTWCDSTISGMGRGAGNVKTEELLVELMERNLHPADVGDLSKTVVEFEKMKKELGWGANYFYHFAANKRIHPTYVQNLLADPKYSVPEVWKILDGLSKVEATAFDTEKLESIFNYEVSLAAESDWDATNWVDGKDVLILGAGESVQTFSNAIQQYIDVYSPFVISLNSNPNIHSASIDATLLCNDSRMVFDSQTLLAEKYPLVMPISSMSGELKQKFKNREVLNYGIEVKPKSFVSGPKGCVLPKKLALGYALALSTSGGAKKIYLAGFDGYQVGDVRNVEVSELLNFYKHSEGALPIEALTPTSFDVRHGSVFAPRVNKPNFAVIIPARYKSSRFEGKPLAEINGKPMIIHVWKKCSDAVGQNNVFVATDDDRISKVCNKAGAQVLKTSETCLTGTDRLAEAAREIDRDFYINVQGDEPLIEPQDIVKILEYATRFPDQIVNGMCEITSESDFISSNTPKVVVNGKNQLLYVSRAPIPSNKDSKFRFGYRQVCIYSFPKKALLDFGEYGDKTPLENEEDIEILRFLELDYDVQMIEFEKTTIAVDTKEDLDRVRKLL